MVVAEVKAKNAYGLGFLKVHVLFLDGFHVAVRLRWRNNLLLAFIKYLSLERVNWDGFVLRCRNAASWLHFLRCCLIYWDCTWLISFQLLSSVQSAAVLLHLLWWLIVIATLNRLLWFNMAFRALRSLSISSNTSIRIKKPSMMLASRNRRGSFKRLKRFIYTVFSFKNPFAYLIWDLFFSFHDNVNRALFCLIYTGLWRMVWL